MEFVDLKSQYRLLEDSIHQRIRRVLEHGQYILGPEVAELESKLTAYTGAGHCITCASGTEALLVALMALGVKPGDEVVTTPFSFIATAEVIVLLGAKPVFVDIQADTYNLDPRKLESAITPRTRAIMPVSLYGQPADMDEINAIAFRHNLPVIEDAAQSFGAEYKGRKSCNLSAIGCTSFFPSKPLGCYGDGGAIFTDDDRLATAMHEIRIHGQERRYVHSRIGVGGRMDTLQCAVVLAKLERFDWEVAERRRIGTRYTELLAREHARLTPPIVKSDRTSVYAQYTVRVENRAAFQKHLQERGIPTAVHYPVPIHRQPAYTSYAPASGLAEAERAAEHVLCLPMHPYISEIDQQRVADAVIRAAGELA